MSQEYDIQEYWEQFDDQTRWIGFQEKTEKPSSHNEEEAEELLKTIDWVVFQDESKQEYTTPDNHTTDATEKVEDYNLTMYGLKRKRTEFSQNSDDIKKKLEEVFENMKQTVK